jgi:hypothetical protein
MRNASRASSRDGALVALLLLAGATGACHGPVRSASAPYTITGRVETVDSGSLSLRHKSGRRLTLAIADATTVTNDGHPAAPADIAAGMRVVVVYHFTNAAAVADEVRLFRGPINYP